jgi:hypothetical protein
MSGYLRIGGALTVGMVLIFGAFVFSKNTAVSHEANIVSVSSERTYIEATDSDSDGVEDWKEIFPKPDTTITLPEPKIEKEEGGLPYIEPTTFTGKFAKAFFTDYFTMKNYTADPTGEEFKKQFVTRAVDSIEKGTRGKEFSATDVHIVSDSPDNVGVYGNDSAFVFLSLDKPLFAENELQILNTILETKNPEHLKTLSEIKQRYAHAIDQLLLVSVPEPLVKAHISLLNSLEALRADTEAMEIVFSDPLYTFSRSGKYPQHIQDFSTTLKNISFIVVDTYGIRYEATEPGSLFKLISYDS